VLHFPQFSASWISSWSKYESWISRTKELFKKSYTNVSNLMLVISWCRQITWR
jgi:hypothetical protein